MKLYVGNLPFSVNSDDLEQMFSGYGTVTSTQVISDRETGRSRGFGFVEIESDDAGPRPSRRWTVPTTAAAVSL